MRKFQYSGTVKEETTVSFTDGYSLTLNKDSKIALQVTVADEPAPDLLESCEKLLEWIDNLEAQGYTDELINAMPNNFERLVARRAVEKARGQ